MRQRTIGVTVLALAFAATACANAPSGRPRERGIAYPSGATDLVLRIDEGGGFVAPQATLAQMPTFSLFGDGLAITQGVQPMIYPGPALPSVPQERLSADAVQLLLRAAIDAGLDHDRNLTDLGSVGIADASTTTFTLTVEGQTHTTRVYALGELASKPAGMSQDEFQAREDLLAFEQKTVDVGWLPDGSVSDAGSYRPSALRVYVSPYQGDQNLTEPPVAWPLTPGLADFGQPAPGTVQGMRCGTVTGTDAATLLPVVGRANQLTPWTSGGSRFSLLLRVLLPDEQGC